MKQFLTHLALIKCINHFINWVSVTELTVGKTKTSWSVFAYMFSLVHACTRSILNYEMLIILFTFQGDSTANGGADNHRCANNIRLAADQEGTFFCKPTASGRYVYIRNAMGLSGGVVVVCEVEVYSSYISSKFSCSDYNNKIIL